MDLAHVAAGRSMLNDIVNTSGTSIMADCDNTEREYVWRLDDATQERARVELNEDPTNRQGAIETLRQWVKDQPWLRSPTDNEFLLKFLRPKKFSQLEARKAIESYWAGRDSNPAWFGNRDPRDEKIQDYLSSGVFLRLPRTDKHGRVHVMVRPGVVDPVHVKNDLGVATIFRTSTCMSDWLVMDERCQINGIVAIVDLSGYTSQHRKLTHSPENLKKLISIYQNVYSMRLKSINLYNLPLIFEAVLTIVKPILRQKFRDRINICGKSLVSLYDNIDMSVLPREYLPDDYEGEHSGSIQDILDQMKRDMTQPDVVEYIQSLSNGHYGVDLNLKRAANEPSMSFRKLNVE